MVQMLHVFLDKNLMILHVQKIAMHNASYHHKWNENSTSDVQHSIIRVCNEYTVEVWYKPDKLHTLDLGSSMHLSLDDGVWHIVRMLAESAWCIARMLADGALHIGKILSSGTYMHWLGN